MNLSTISSPGVYINEENVQPAATSFLPKFAFQVIWDGNEMVFSEVSGLSDETEVIAYRAGDNKAFSTIKTPGIEKFKNITLKKGVFKGDAGLWAGFNAVKMNTPKRYLIIINLLDESNAVIMNWVLQNAFITKVSGSDLKSEKNEVAVESVEIAFETLTVTNK
jgi:phage tail-like protein